MTATPRTPFPAPVPPSADPPTLPDAPLDGRTFLRFAACWIGVFALLVPLVDLLGFLREWSLIGLAAVVALLAGAFVFGLPLWAAAHHTRQRVQLGWQIVDGHRSSSSIIRKVYRRHYGPKTAGPDRIDAIPINRGGQPVYRARVVDAVVTPEPIDDREPEQQAERETQRLDGYGQKDKPWSTTMGMMNELRGRGIDPSWEVCRGLGISRKDWEAGRDTFVRMGYMPEAKKGVKTRWL